ncbi:TPA: hypothetical protein ACG1JD_002677 [Citrobacter sedlakii]
MSNIDIRALRKKLNRRLNDAFGFQRTSGGKHTTISLSIDECKSVIVALDEMEAKDKQIAELVAGRQNLQRTMGVYVHAYEEAKGQVAKDVQIKARLCIESNSLFDRLRAAEKRNAELTEFLTHIKKCLVKNREYAPVSHEEIDTLLGIRAAGIGKGE